MAILRDMKSKYVYISSSVSAPSPSSQDWNYAAIFWQKQEEDSKYRLFYCSNFFTIRFSLNKNFIIRLFNKFLQYASSVRNCLTYFIFTHTCKLFTFVLDFILSPHHGDMETLCETLSAYFYSWILDYFEWWS